MVFLTSSLLLELLVLTATLVLLYCCYLTKVHSYWKDINVPYVKPHWFFGNVKNPILNKTTWSEFSESYYNKFKDKGFGGLFIFIKPAVKICSPDLIESVLVKDFIHFHDRASLWNSHQLFSQSLMDTTGEKWRTLRYNLIPTFASSKLKGMFRQIFNCGDSILRQIEESIMSEKPVEMEPLIFEFTTEVIASCTFGVQLMADSTESKKFRNAVNHIFNSSPLHVTKVLHSLIFPKICSFFGISSIHQSTVEFFVNLTKSIVEYRKRNNIKRADFLQLMLILKNREENGIETSTDLETSEEDKQVSQLRHIPPHRKLQNTEKLFTEDRITSLMFSFLSSGMAPSRTTIVFALFEVARNASIQKRLQGEIDSALVKHRKWSYETFKEMVYLDQVVQETLRLYPINPCLTRLVTKPYKVPGTDVTLKENMLVFIPSAAIHKDGQFYPSPEDFDPERFAGNNYKPSSTFLPFGHGPRICIAIRFAVLMVKVCLARILSKYTIQLSRKMQLPVCLDRNEFSPKIKGGLWLEIEKRESQQHL